MLALMHSVQAIVTFPAVPGDVSAITKAAGAWCVLIGIFFQPATFFGTDALISIVHTVITPIDKLFSSSIKWHRPSLPVSYMV